MAGLCNPRDGTTKFADGGRESSLEAPCALVATACTLGSIQNPPWGVGWSLVGCGCHKDPDSDQIPILLCSVHSWYQSTALTVLENESHTLSK